ncbi:hypothetical protein BSKO_13827 [Bryopsis sp. KO-2023]|nr:hypothetical protein BSKO_13827 [Bryopsis sp. KO-2023]
MADVWRPQFHIMPKKGWLNDPNGPIFYKGRYHMFFQHIPNSTNWDWCMEWGHVVSSDLAHWHHLPNAIQPSEGGPDANGCWSGCCGIDVDGCPVLLHTGVVLRTNIDGRLPPPEFDLGIQMIETQCCAKVSDPDDKNMEHWIKQEEPFLRYPPDRLALTGWRDPFLVHLPATSANEPPQRKLMILGSGFSGKGGAVLKYTTHKSLTSDWKYDGVLIQHQNSGSGEVWECPVLVPLPKHANNSMSDGARPDGITHVLMVGVHFPNEQPRRYRPVIYWLGRLTEEGDFTPVDLENPRVLDSGSIVYAPNAMIAPDGRTLMWVWMHERGGGPTRMDYNGCLSIPRVLTVLDGELHQWPAAELEALRTGDGFKISNMQVSEGSLVSFLSDIGPRFDMNLTISWEDHTQRFGLIITATDTPESLVIEFDIKSKQLRSCSLDPEDFNGEEKIQIESKGTDEIEGGQLGMRVIVDGPLVEVFTSHGAALSGRVVRPMNGDMKMFSCGGKVSILEGCVWKMGSAWS